MPGAVGLYSVARIIKRLKLFWNHGYLQTRANKHNNVANNDTEIEQMNGNCFQREYKNKNIQQTEENKTKLFVCMFTTEELGRASDLYNNFIIE